jgi:hypothetical protein
MRKQGGLSYLFHSYPHQFVLSERLRYSFDVHFRPTGAVHLVDILLSTHISENIRQGPEKYPVLFRP